MSSAPSSSSSFLALPQQQRRIEAASSRRGNIEEALSAIDRNEIANDYGRYNELFWRRELLPRDVVAACSREAEELKSRVVRKRVPGYKKSGSVNYYDIIETAPNILAVYKDPALIAFLSSIAGATLLPCPDDDPHSCALYYYQEEGDGIGFHYDSSQYEGDRFTVLVGLVNRSEQAKLVCHPYRKINGPALELQIATHPGTFVFFNGGNIYHSVTPIGANEERIVLTLEYITNPNVTPIMKFLANMKDAMTYFGFKGMFGARRRYRAARQTQT